MKFVAARSGGSASTKPHPGSASYERPAGKNGLDRTCQALRPPGATDVAQARFVLYVPQSGFSPPLMRTCCAVARAPGGTSWKEHDLTNPQLSRMPCGFYGRWSAVMTCRSTVGHARCHRRRRVMRRILQITSKTWTAGQQLHVVAPSVRVVVHSARRRCACHPDRRLTSQPPAMRPQATTPVPHAWSRFTRRS